ncbi:MAG: hypothetical protein JST93_00800 [Acidobacteria bacterium]|nr:hypothetical protein [Acidobacteriota bacterium]
MRTLAALCVLSLAACGPTLEFNNSQSMTADDMLRRATLVFAGVIRHQTFDHSPFLRFRVPGQNPRTNYWRVLRRDVDVETIFRGEEPSRRISVYEIYWTGATSGDWNFTLEGQRALFMVFKDHGRYHVVLDWWRSIFPITSGPHRRLPMDESQPFWERIDLLNFWYPPQAEGEFTISSPYRLSLWRTVKLLRGLLRHPNAHLRIDACRELIGYDGLDECYEGLTVAERAQLRSGGYVCCSAEEVAERRYSFQTRTPDWFWRHRGPDVQRLYTSVRDPALRAQFCRLWHAEHPADTDTGCDPANPHPATIVTEEGDVPLPALKMN